MAALMVPDRFLLRRGDLDLGKTLSEGYDVRLALLQVG
jgi:hypothetical protein